MLMNMIVFAVTLVAAELVSALILYKLTHNEDELKKDVKMKLNLAKDMVDDDEMWETMNSLTKKAMERSAKMAVEETVKDIEVSESDVSEG